MVKEENGETHLPQPRKEAKRVSLYQPKMISVAAGDQLLIRRNGTSGSGSKLLNGELVEVREIAPTGLITLRDGRTIPSTFRHLLHGYAVSSQSSQGKAVDRVLVAIDAMSAASDATRATLYVAASRGRESCTLFTDDMDLLAHALEMGADFPGLKKYTIQPTRNFLPFWADSWPDGKKPPTHSSPKK